MNMKIYLNQNDRQIGLYSLDEARGLTAAINQWQQHRPEFFVRYRTLFDASHHLARLENLALASAELGFTQ